jgi:hypothetical protein
MDRSNVIAGCSPSLTLNVGWASNFFMQTDRQTRWFSHPWQMAIVGWSSWLIVASILVVCGRLHLPRIGIWIAVCVMGAGLICSALAALPACVRGGFREALLVSLSMAVWACIGALTLRLLDILPR